MIDHPELVPYHIDSMPRAPKEFVMEVDPTSAKIKVTELTQDVKEMKGVAKKVDLGSHTLVPHLRRLAAVFRRPIYRPTGIRVANRISTAYCFFSIT